MYGIRYLKLAIVILVPEYLLNYMLYAYVKPSKMHKLIINWIYLRSDGCEYVFC